MKFNCTFKRTVGRSSLTAETVKPEVPEGLLKKCNVCKSAVFVEEVKDNRITKVMLRILPPPETEDDEEEKGGKKKQRAGIRNSEYLL